MSSVKKDLLSQKGSLVTLYVKPRKSAKKNIYVIGGENDKTKYFRLRRYDEVSCSLIAGVPSNCSSAF